MEALQKIAEIMVLGVVDCLYGSYALIKWLKKERFVKKAQLKTSKSHSAKSKVQTKTVWDVIFQCFVFGLLILFSMLIFHYVVMMLIYHYFLTSLLSSEEESFISWVPTLMNLMFSGLWKYPIFFVSRILTFVWYQDIANMTCEDVGIKRRVTQSKSEELSEQLMSAIVQTLFLLQGYVMFIFPLSSWLQNFLATVHLSLLYALYAFEYRWCQKGWSMNRRLSYIESKWPYFIGFGLPLAILTSCIQSYIESICVFSVLFPVALITSTLTFNDKLQSFNKPIRFFGLATPVADFIVCRGFGLFYN